jgi:predicted  nucleic acid-binding Zn-ribbon protein
MEMKLVTVMLTINFLFDLAVWTMLWNMIFYAGKLTIGLWSPVAFFCGLLFAAIIFVYERQFMTADLHGQGIKILFPVFLRLCVVLVAAAVTTQPFEVLVFNGPIQRRAHEESVRREALRQLRSLQDMQTRLKRENLDTTVEGNNLKKHEKTLNDAKEELKQHQTDAAVAQGEIETADSRIRAARQQLANARTRGVAAGASRRLSAAQTMRSRAEGDLKEANAAIQISEQTVTNLGKDVGSAFGTLVGKQKEIEAAETRLRDWIKQVARTEPGEEVIENTTQTPKLTFKDMDYDFFQRLSVINDLYTGRPPRWFDTSAQDRARIAELFAFSDADESDPITQQRRADEARAFVWCYWAVISIAAVIPLLLLALKALLPIDLKRYYSRAAQERAGSYETLRFALQTDGLTAAFESGNNHRNGGRSSQA